ncbi:hypothetical protein LZ554_008473 [Drepanopeziza brunnea f. sp. 'monogermtubi']|nr:hypothetical protein LZ554_008473 [Drepanopeziza brunnea f. sp. 'monogermtubi']
MITAAIAHPKYLHIYRRLVQSTVDDAVELRSRGSETAHEHLNQILLNRRLMLIHLSIIYLPALPQTHKIPVPRSTAHHDADATTIIPLINHPPPIKQHACIGTGPSSLPVTPRRDKTNSGKAVKPYLPVAHRPLNPKPGTK